jgi:hypothetical protein
MAQVIERSAREEDLSIWSDMHKDAYGCRPHALPSPTDEELHDEFKKLGRLIEIDERYERQAQIRAQYVFERNIEYHIRREGLTRLQATRAMVNRAVDERLTGFNQGLDISWRDCLDFEFICHKLGMSYDLAGQLCLQYRGQLADDFPPFGKD